MQDAEDAPLANFVGRVWHASLQPRQDPDQDPNAPVPEGEKFDPAKQMPGGWPATFAFRVRFLLFRLSSTRLPNGF